MAPSYTVTPNISHYFTIGVIIKEKLDARINEVIILKDTHRSGQVQIKLQELMRKNAIKSKQKTGLKLDSL